MAIRHWFLNFAWAMLIGATRAVAAPASPSPFSAVETVLAKHCLDCHATQEPEGGLVLESFEALMKGGQSGIAVVPGRSDQSLLVQSVENGLLVDGKLKKMPPGKREKLGPEEIAVLKRWIDGGALPPSELARRRTREVMVPKIEPTVSPRRGIRSAVFSSTLDLVAIALPGEVQLLETESRQVIHRLTGIRGSANALAFSLDGRSLAVAAGEPALFGQATLWDAAAGKLLRTIEAHDDALYAIAISPDGKTLATGSYDQKIKLWHMADGRLLHTLSAHNAAIYSLAFRPDGKILASASGDRTVKLWQVETGKRVETLNQPLKEVYAVAWSPDGKRLAAGAADNRLRVWQVSESAAETTNPLLASKFAHDGVILNVVWAPDGKTLVSTADDQVIKLWNATSLTERLLLEKQPDLAPAVAFLKNGARLAVGRLDGSADFYNVSDGKRVLPAPPGISRIEPPGVQAGVRSLIKLMGTNLGTITNITVGPDNRLRMVLISADNDSVTASLESPSDLPRGFFEVSVRGPGGESGKKRVFIDDLSQVSESGLTNSVQLPVGIWGMIDRPGQIDEYHFAARAGQTLTVDLGIRSVGSKLQNGSVTLFNEKVTVLGRDEGFDGEDRFIALTVPADAVYRVAVSDRMLAGSKDHVYRLTLGTLPYVTGVFPLDVPTNTESTVEVIGYNLPNPALVQVKAGSAGKLEVSLDPRRFRAQRTFQVQAIEGARQNEQEPNERIANATKLSVPCSVNGRIGAAGDTDYFQFSARGGEAWILETDAARRGSPADTKIEVLSSDGKPVARQLLQAVRNTAINFRGVDSNGANLRLDNYEEMELNEFLYINGDVMRLFRMPQGPDSDMLMYTSAGKRRAWFDTSAVSHALDEQGFIVEPHPLGTKLVPNGLPVFTLNFENDDDGHRKLGSDSKLHFVAPANGDYYVRVSDTRGHGGVAFVYRLEVRQARPDFAVSLAGTSPTVSPGSGQIFTLSVDRIDGFEGEVRAEITGLPRGFTAATPIIVEAGQSEAKVTLFATFDAPPPEATNATSARLVASALIDGRLVTEEPVSLGTIKLGPAPKLYVGLEPFSETATNRYDPAVVQDKPSEITIRPGETIAAWLKIHRKGHKDLVTFFAENLPHGVIVADIGLNGVLIPKDENERKIFFTAAKWVQEQDRLFFMIEQQAGRQTSRPVLLKIRQARGTLSAN